MKSQGRWVDILLFNFCAVSLLGFTLRSKILFPLPFLDYNRLLDAHFHFAFGGWVTLALASLFINELLLEQNNYRIFYNYILVLILAGAWLLLIASPLPANDILASVCSTTFIGITYLFTGIIIPDIYKSQLTKTVKLLAISSLVCLVLSSLGVFTLAWLFASKSLNSFAYRDALYTYLHLQYNGFFTLAVFAILFNRVSRGMSVSWKKKAHNFSAMLCFSVLPSMFLTYLWRDPNQFYRIMAVIGSVSLFVCVILFFRLSGSLLDYYQVQNRIVRNMILLSISAFLIKTFLQSFTLFPAIGNAVFGDRPIIIGFLHLVFLGFVTLFLIAWFTQDGFLNPQLKITKVALFLFTLSVILNEGVLMTQGLGAMFIKSSYIFPWVLWLLSIMLMLSATMIFIARLRSKT